MISDPSGFEGDGKFETPTGFTPLPAAAIQRTRAFSMRLRYKALLLFSVPLLIIIAGEVFNLPYTRGIGAFIVAGYILLGNLYGTDRFEK